MKGAPGRRVNAWDAGCRGRLGRCHDFGRIFSAKPRRGYRALPVVRLAAGSSDRPTHPAMHPPTHLRTAP